ncbi:MAG: ABC transporter ATP-binding protein [Bdellovibrio sp.]|nr:ABC transporter ATP-binding protein [Bdellovibrio sp.]
MLKIENLAVNYAGIKALRGVSLHVEPGELVALIGSNGSGKTSLLRAISGIVEPSEGNILIDGKRINDIPSHKRVALGLAHCPEARHVFAQQTIEDNLHLGAYLRYGKESKHQIQETLEEVYTIFPKLRERSKQQAGTLSGGEQQMLAIGRALMLKPKILMLDEPSMGLAPVIINEVFNVIEKLRQSKTTTILLVEQLAFMALKVADRGYVLEQGLVRIEGKAADLKGNPVVQEAYLGLAKK